MDRSRGNFTIHRNRFLSMIFWDSSQQTFQRYTALFTSGCLKKMFTSQYVNLLLRCKSVKWRRATRRHHTDFQGAILSEIHRYGEVYLDLSIENSLSSLVREIYCLHFFFNLFSNLKFPIKLAIIYKIFTQSAIPQNMDNDNTQNKTSQHSWNDLNSFLISSYRDEDEFIVDLFVSQLN